MNPERVLQRRQLYNPFRVGDSCICHPGWRTTAAPGSLPWAMLSDPVGVKSSPLRPLLGAFLIPPALPVVADEALLCLYQGTLASTDTPEGTLRQSIAKSWRTRADNSSRVPSRNQKNCRVVVCCADGTCTVESVCRQVNSVLVATENPLPSPARPVAMIQRLSREITARTAHGRFSPNSCVLGPVIQRTQSPPRERSAHRHRFALRVQHVRTELLKVVEHRMTLQIEARAGSELADPVRKIARGEALFDAVIVGKELGDDSQLVEPHLIGRPACRSLCPRHVGCLAPRHYAGAVPRDRFRCGQADVLHAELGHVDRHMPGSSAAGVKCRRTTVYGGLQLFPGGRHRDRRDALRLWYMRWCLVAVQHAAKAGQCRAQPS